MKDDETFFNQFQEAPRPDFAAALYTRINRPMNAQTQLNPMRRVALTFAVVLALLMITAFAYPPARAQALAILRQIGVITLTDQPPAEIQATAQALDPNKKGITAETAEEAAKLAGFSVLVPQQLPAGFLASGPMSISDNASGKIVASLYRGKARSSFILVNQYRYAPGDSFTDTLSPQEAVEDVTVRGHAGVWIANRLMVAPGDGSAEKSSSSWLRWEEDGIVYSIISNALTLEDALAFAESLK